MDIVFLGLNNDSVNKIDLKKNALNDTNFSIIRLMKIYKKPTHTSWVFIVQFLASSNPSAKSLHPRCLLKVLKT
jgi:hypothetical protein